MPVMMLYNFLFKQVSQVLPQERITRLRNLRWLMIGILQSKSVHLSHIANKIPSLAKLLSVTRRLTRFLANPSVRPRRWYKPIARWLVPCVLNSPSTRQIGGVASPSFSQSFKNIPHRDFLHVFFILVSELFNIECIFLFGVYVKAKDS